MLMKSDIVKLAAISEFVYQRNPLDQATDRGALGIPTEPDDTLDHQESGRRSGGERGQGIVAFA